MSEKKQGDSIAEALEKIKSDLQEHRMLSSVDREQLTQQIVALREPLVRHLFRLAKNKADAEDLAHDTIAQALKKLDQYDGKNIAGWVYTIGTNLFLSRGRKITRHKELLTEKGEVEVLVDEPPQDPMLLTIITESALQLSSKHQEVIRMWLSGRTMHEIAGELHIPRGTVVSRLFRARTLLRVLLQEKGYELP